MPVNAEVLDDFAALPPRLRRRIDQAFDKAIESQHRASSTRPAKRRKVDYEDGGGFMTDVPQPGGFLPEAAPGGFIIHEDEAEPGGFVAEPPLSEDDTNDLETGPAEHMRISLDLIPTALQLLDLQPDDEDILSVFRNAASGWEDAPSVASSSARRLDREMVSRKDWRAVCAALLDTGAEDAHVAIADAASGKDTQAREYDEGEDSDSGSEDAYQQSTDEGSDSAEDSDGGSDDEYMEGGFIPTKTKPKAKARSTHVSKKSSRKHQTASPGLESDESLDPDGPWPLTARQKRESRRVFGLFFPDVKDDDLGRQKIMIKDITRIAKLLNEKITAEEAIEMLEAFSTSPDKSMALPDFERMMVTARLA